MYSYNEQARHIWGFEAKSMSSLTGIRVRPSSSGSQVGMDATTMTPSYTVAEDSVAGDLYNGEPVESTVFTLRALEPGEDAGRVDAEELPPSPAYSSP